MQPMDLFKVVLLIMLFYSFSITLISHSIPDEMVNYVTTFSDLATEITLEGVSADVQDSIERQTNIPVIELGALVFYSGNIIIDLLLNFAFAIPEMIGLLINGIMLLLNVDSYLFAFVELFAGVVITVFYFIGLITLLTNVRSGRTIT